MLMEGSHDMVNTKTDDIRIIDTGHWMVIFLLTVHRGVADFLETEKFSNKIIPSCSSCSTVHARNGLQYLSDCVATEQTKATLCPF